MSLRSVVLLTVIWLAISSESLYNNENKRRQLLYREDNGNMRFHSDTSLEHNPPLSLVDEDNESLDEDPIFELDKPLPIEQVAVPVGGKANLPCDTATPGQEPGGFPEQSGFFMVMWFKEPKEKDPDDPNYEPSSSSVASSGEPIFTYDIRKSRAKTSKLPVWWSSPTAFGTRAYFHTENSEGLLQNGQDQVDHLTVDRALATDTGIYRCRVDFLKAPTRNRLVNLTVIVAPDRPKISYEYGNAVDTDRLENYQQDMGITIVVDEGSPSVTLVCRVNGGWPLPRLTWYHENTVLDATYYHEDFNGGVAGGGRGYRQKQYHNHGTIASAAATVTVNRLQLTNLTRWHPIMSQRQPGTARLTCQASNSITPALHGGGSRGASVIAGNGNLPPPATTEHALVRLNLKPTEVQIVSIKENDSGSKTNESRAFNKNDGEVLGVPDAVGQKKYTIRVDRTYRAECRSSGSRPLATIEWYILKKNQQFNVGRSTNGTAPPRDMPATRVLLDGKRDGMALEGTVVGVVETQQVPEMTTDKYEMVVTTSILSFVLHGPSSSVINENEENESTLVCRAYNPVIKTVDRHYVETKITLNVQYPPVVELRFGNRMLDTGRIGPGEDVYFECVARANPSTTIRYSWYHNGVRLTQDVEKRRPADDGDKRAEKSNSKLASRVIQYSQLGSLVLQSVMVAAAGKYACEATNGIERDSDKNKTMSNTVRLYVKHPPVCQHREEMVIVTKKSDTEQGPAIRCRAKRGHPPATEYRWTFYPERLEAELEDGRLDDRRRPLESGETGYGPVRGGLDPSSLAAADTAVLRGGEVTTPYMFTTSTPVLKSYPLAVAAATSGPSSYGAHANFLRGRLECRAVNAVGVQNVPCVYRITDKTTIDQGGKGVQEITDCRLIPRNELSGNVTGARLACRPETGPNRRSTRFCIACSLNTSSWHDRRPRFDYVLQLYRTPRSEPAAAAATTTAVVVAYNVTGVMVTEDGATGGTGSGRDDGDYYTDPGDDDDDDGDGFRDDYVSGRDAGNAAVRRVVFGIDDGVEPGTYRGRIYNGIGATVSAIVKGTINVATVDLNGNDGNYIVDDVDDNETGGDGEDDGSTLWHRATMALAEMFSMVVPGTPMEATPEDELAHRAGGRQPRKRWRAASFGLTATLVAVLLALSCGVCAAMVAILYRRRHRCGHRAYGLACNDDNGVHGVGDGGEGRVGDDRDTGNVTNGKSFVGHRKPDAVQRSGDSNGGSVQQRHRAADASNSNDDVNDDGASAPLLPAPAHHQQSVQRRSGELADAGGQQPSSKGCPSQLAPRNRRDTNTAILVMKDTAVVTGNRGGGGGGPDVVMSTSATTTMPLATNIASDGAGGNWRPQKQRQQTKLSATNNNHQWSLYRDECQKHDAVTIPYPRGVALTAVSPAGSMKTAMDQYPSVAIPSQAILNALYRESSI